MDVIHPKFKYMNRLITSILFAVLAQGALAQTAPDFSVSYLVEFNGMQAGELNRTLVTNSNGDRVFTSTTKPTGIVALFKADIIIETSIWRYHNNVIQPQSYLYKRTGGRKEKYISADFDWQTMQAVTSNNKQRGQVNIEPHTLDKLVYQLAIMTDLATNKTTLNYLILDGDKLKEYIISIVGEETITTSLGDVSTIKLMRERADAKKRQTTLWCAPKLGFLPVKLEHTEKDGSVFTALLNQLDGIPTEGAITPNLSY